jgi:hypothetical protein
MTREEAEGLWSAMRHDGMVVRAVSLPAAEVVMLKSVLEAHPGVASVHAVRGRVRGPRAGLRVAATRELAAELDGVLHDLAEEIPGLVCSPEVLGSPDGAGGNSSPIAEVVGGGAGE